MATDGVEITASGWQAVPGVVGLKKNQLSTTEPGFDVKYAVGISPPVHNIQPTARVFPL